MADTNLIAASDITVEADKKAVVLFRGNSGRKEETYTVGKAPDSKSSLVLSCKQEILQTLDLDDVLTNLELTGNLMFVAYNGVAGADGNKIQAKVSRLQKQLGDLCGDCVLAMQAFETEGGNVLASLLRAFNWLYKGMEPAAVDELSSCEQAAKKMASQSEKLAKRFDDIGDETEGVLEDTQKAQGAEYDKQQRLKKELRELEVKKEQTEALQKALADNLEEVVTLYNEAKESEATERTRAFAVQLTAAIAGAVGGAVGTVIALKSPYGGGLAAATKAPATPVNAEVVAEKAKVEKEKQKAEEAEQNVKKAKADEAAAVKAEAEKMKAAEKAEGEAEKVKEKVEKAKAELQDAKKQADEAKKQAAAAPAAEKKKKEADAKKKEEKVEAKKDDVKGKEQAAKVATEKVKQAKGEQKVAKEAAQKAKENHRLAVAALKTLNQSLDAMQKSLDKMAVAALDHAEKLRSEKLDLFQTKLELQKKKAETLASIKAFASTIANTEVERGIAQSAVESLQAAIAALKMIVTSLQNASLYWKSMEQYCRQLSSSEFKKEIGSIQKYVPDPKERALMYVEPDFVCLAVDYAARWQALKVICGEYKAAAGRAKDTVLKNIRKAPTIDEARKQAPLLAEKMLLEVEEGMRLIAEDRKVIEAEKKAVEKEKPPALLVA